MGLVAAPAFRAFLDDARLALVRLRRSYDCGQGNKKKARWSRAVLVCIMFVFPKKI